MRREIQTMVDKIRWGTCVIALIFRIFKMEFSKSTVIRFEMHCLPPPLPQYNVETREKQRVHVSNIVGGERGGGDEQVQKNLFGACKKAPQM